MVGSFSKTLPIKVFLANSQTLFSHELAAFVAKPLMQGNAFVAKPLMQGNAFTAKPLMQGNAFVAKPLMQGNAFTAKPLMQGNAFTAKPLIRFAHATVLHARCDLQCKEMYGYVFGK